MAKELSEKIRKDLMLGLIYPAVLGSIIYLLISKAFEQVNTLLNQPFHFDWPLTLKFVLLLITLGFYLCDYMYATFTNDFKRMFFWFDIIFIIDLYGTIYLIYILTEKDDTPPNARGILAGYFVFMILYLVWDCSESKRCKDAKEAHLYKCIVAWEIGSMAILLVSFILTFVTIIQCYIENLFFIPLAVITGCFAHFTHKKREFYVLPDYERSFT